MARCQPKRRSRSHQILLYLLEELEILLSLAEQAGVGFTPNARTPTPTFGFRAGL